jgi:hypothetical protein
LAAGALALSAPVFADVDGGVSSDPQAKSATTNGTNFDPPCLFGQSLPLQGGAYLNPASNAFYLFGNAGVLNECSNFAVTGQSSPNFLAWNCIAANADGTIPELPELIFFATPQSQVSMNIGDGVDVGQNAGILVFDAAFNQLGFDTITTGPALQNVSVNLGAPRISAVLIFGPCRLVADDIRYN